MDNIEVQVNELEVTLVSLLKIDVIVRNLEKFLKVKDLANLRILNRDMNQVILCQTKFLSRCKIVLKESMYEDPCLKTISFLPKNIKIHASTIRPGYEESKDEEEDLKHKEIIDVICKLVENCEFIELAGEGGVYWYLYDLYKFYPEGDYKEKSVPNHFPPVLQVISCVKNLKELKLNFGAQLFFNKADEEHVEACASVQKIEIDDSFPHYCPPIFLKLKGLSRINGIAPNEYYFGASRSQTQMQFRELDLRGQSSEFCARYFDNIYPSLKILRLEAGKEAANEQGSPAIAFLQNHIDQLEELQVWVGSPGAEQVLSTISKSQKRFTILTVVLEYEVKKSTFIDFMKQMRDAPIDKFELRTFWERDGGPLDIFSVSLPMSLRAFTVGSISGSGLFYDPSKLKHFPPITQIDLDDFVGPINSILKGICKHLHKLKYLRINCHPKAAKRLFKKGASSSAPAPDETFANLKDLESLDIFNAPDLPTDIINGIKCRKLHSLSVPNALDQGVIAAIFRQSRGLKSILCGPNFREIERSSYVDTGLQS